MRRRIQSWGASTRTTTPSTDRNIINSIAHEFHTTFANDQAIADRLCAQCIDTTGRQVKRVRLQQAWRRREDDPDQRETTRQETFAALDEAFEEGIPRQYGRDMTKVASSYPLSQPHAPARCSIISTATRSR
jgi:hypothetical protein